MYTVALMGGCPHAPSLLFEDSVWHAKRASNIVSGQRNPSMMSGPLYHVHKSGHVACTLKLAVPVRHECRAAAIWDVLSEFSCMLVRQASRRQ